MSKILSYHSIAESSWQADSLLPSSLNVGLRGNC